MVQDYLNAVLLLQVFGEGVGGVYGAVLASGATKVDAEVHEAALDVVFHRGIHNAEYVVQVFVHGAVLLEEIDDRFVAASQFFVRFIAAWVVHEATIKYKTTTVATGIFWNTTSMIRKAIDRYRE